MKICLFFLLLAKFISQFSLVDFITFLSFYSFPKFKGLAAVTEF